MLQNWMLLFVPKVKRWVNCTNSIAFLFLFSVFWKSFDFEIGIFLLQLQLGVDESYNLFVAKVSGSGGITIEVCFCFSEHYLLLNSNIWWYFYILLCDSNNFVVILFYNYLFFIHFVYKVAIYFSSLLLLIEVFCFSGQRNFFKFDSDCYVLCFTSYWWKLELEWTETNKLDFCFDWKIGFFLFNFYFFLFERNSWIWYAVLGSFSDDC
jgi:hypothetical protein